jgi:hypothetical protein
MEIYKIENTKNQKKIQQIPDIVYQAIMKSQNTLNWYNNSISLLIRKKYFTRDYSMYNRTLLENRLL